MRRLLTTLTKRSSQCQAWQARYAQRGGSQVANSSKNSSC